MSTAIEGGYEEQKEPLQKPVCGLVHGSDKTIGCRTKPDIALTPSRQAIVLNQWYICLSSTMFVLHRIAQSVVKTSIFHCVHVKNVCIFLHSKTLVVRT